MTGYIMMRMINRSILNWALFFLSIFGIACGSEGEPSGTSKPNIIFLLTDDQRYDALGCMGNNEILTPRIDELAGRGLLFTNYYNTTAICMASRATIMTGMYEYKTGCNFQHGPLTQDKFESSYPVLLREAGYRTGFAGKFGFGVVPSDVISNSNWHSNDRMPMDQFDWWRGWPGQGKYATADNEFMAEYAERYPHVSGALGAAAVDFIRKSGDQGKPFCLSVSFKAPHSPVRPDPEYDDVYEGKTFTKPCNYGVEAADHLPEQSKTDRQFKKLWKRWAPGNYDEAIAQYYQLIYGVDVAVGMILDELKKLGIEDNTIIIFTSDNGYFCGSHGFGGKVLPYEEGSRAPLIIYDPRSKYAGEGKRSGALSGNIDMAPTILDLAGLKIPEHMDGVSLVPVLRKPDREVKEDQLFIQAWGERSVQNMTVIKDNFKYLYWYYGEGMEPAEELYDLDADCNEMENLAGSPGMEDRLEEMRKVYDRYLEQWKSESVDGYRYPDYGVLFDRNIDWQQKSDILKIKGR